MLTRCRFRLLLNLLVPLIFVVVTALGSHQRLGNLGLLIGLSISYGLMSSGMLGYSLAVARDRDGGVFQRLRVTPTPAWAIIGSRIVVQVVLALVMSVIVLVVGSVLNHVAFEWNQYLGMLGISLLGALLFVSLGQAIVGLFKSPTAVSAVGRVLYIVLILAGIFGQTGLLCSGFQDVAAWTPIGSLTNLFTVALGAAW